MPTQQPPPPSPDLHTPVPTPPLGPEPDRVPCEQECHPKPSAQDAFQFIGATGARKQHRHRKKLILCFDGTGNKFKGNAGDTNILKIFRMLDRTGGDQFHYYQPGIGTYITDGTLSRVHVGSRMKSWYNKAMDAALGTSFDQHVVGGYKFLMRFYAEGDDIFLFGFSRGAYTARFLSEMLDHVGLVSQGNEEMVLFAWKTFSNWQQRSDNVRKEELYNYMKAFRETFARPVRRVRFLGLFDTVNSVPRFEQAWLKRNRGFPYTARSTARVIRHAVGIDERRAKFRQDLVEKGDVAEIVRRRSWGTKHKKRKDKKKPILKLSSGSPSDSKKTNRAHPGEQLQPNNRSAANLSVKSHGGSSVYSYHAPYTQYESDSDEDEEEEEDGSQRRLKQDIEEVWFPGAHGDIGGGWDLPENEEPLSHGPLVWMVREARKAGVVFDKRAMRDMKCYIDEIEEDSSAESSEASSVVQPPGAAPVPAIRVTSTHSHLSPKNLPPASDGVSGREYLHRCCTRGKIHDCLLFNNGIPHVGVIGWKIMEYMPFRRMDLRPNGRWEAISWPLPMGEVRDIPDHIKVHCSVLRRMEADKSYRPGNLLVGGGGRGVRKAPEEYGTGDWVVVENKGCPVGELLMKRKAWESMRRGEATSGHEDEKEKGGSL